MSGNGVETKEKKGIFSRLFGRGEAPAPQEGTAEEAQPEAPKKSWRERLFGGLFRSSQAISKGIAELFTKKKLDALTLEELEDVLIRADLGVGAASRISEAVGQASRREGHRARRGAPNPRGRGRARARARGAPARDR